MVSLACAWTERDARGVTRSGLSFGLPASSEYRRGSCLARSCLSRRLGAVGGFGPGCASGAVGI